MLLADQDCVPPAWASPQPHRGRTARLAVEAVAARERPLAADVPMTQSRQAQGTVDSRPGDSGRLLDVLGKHLPLRVELRVAAF